MRTVSQTDVLDLIGAIYDAALDDARWPEVIRRIGESLGADTHTFTMFGREATGAMRVDRVISVNEDPAYLDSYVRYYLSVNPYVPLMPKFADQVFFSNAVLATEQAWRTEFYNDWQRPQGFDYATGSLITGAEVDFLLNFNRRRKLGAFDETARKLLSQLLPHVARAVALSQRLGNLDADWRAAAALLDQVNLGVILLSKDQHPVYLNPAAEQVLRSRKGLARVKNRIVVEHPEANRALQRAIHGAVCTGAGEGHGSGGHVSVQQPGALEPLAVTVVPLPGGQMGLTPSGRVVNAALLIAIPGISRPLPEDVLRVLLGLTCAEAGLVSALAQDLTVEEAAERRGVAVNTARNQLKAILHKVGVRRQAELMRRVVSLPIAWLRKP